jgi:hypothetical protein
MIRFENHIIIYHSALSHHKAYRFQIITLIMIIYSFTLMIIIINLKNKMVDNMSEVKEINNGE